KIDGNQLDFVQNPDDLKTVLEMVDTKLKELDLL
ncbi:deoxynucleoside kinase, partial [Streptococcus uberis]